MDQYAQALCLADRVNVAILVANCPVRHRSMSPVARHPEAIGIATVVMGAARDIVEHCGVPRFLLGDFPLGNTACILHDVGSQDATLELALRALEDAPDQRTTVQNPQRWHRDPPWKDRALNPNLLGAHDITRIKADSAGTRTVTGTVRNAALRGSWPCAVGSLGKPVPW